MIIVNESYPSSCVALNQLLNPCLLQHRVKGQPRERAQKLACKGPNTPLARWCNEGQVPSPTRPEIGESVEAIRDSETVAKAQVTSLQTSTRAVDSISNAGNYTLDEAIKDAHTVKHLVCTFIPRAVTY